VKTTQSRNTSDIFIYQTENRKDFQDILIYRKNKVSNLCFI
jgi:hypothetical protein